MGVMECEWVCDAVSVCVLSMSVRWECVGGGESVGGSECGE